MSINSSALFAARRADWRRHVVDLQERAYEGALDRTEQERVFVRACELLTPVAIRVLSALRDNYLDGAGEVSVVLPRRVESEQLTGARLQPEGGLLASWNLTWPLLEQSRSRLTGQALPPVQIFAMFPADFTHPHIALFDIEMPRRWIACWPFQVTTADDADRQEPILAVVAEAEMHDRTFAADLNWRLLTL